MADSKKGALDFLDVIGKLLIPVVIAWATIRAEASLKKREADEKAFEVAVNILQSNNSTKIPALRNWAIGIFKNTTGASDNELSTAAVNELRQGASLPNGRPLALPGSSHLRVLIVRPKGTASENSDRIREALAEGGYLNSSAVETTGVFPSQTEVRFYHPEDSASAAALQTYMEQSLHIPTRLNDSSHRADAGEHIVGELHVYVRP